MSEISVNFLWDGSYIGKYDAIFTTQLGKYKVMRLDEKNYGVISLRKDCYSCVVDELKPLFGIVKTGTHYLHYRKKVYVLNKIRYEEKKAVVGIEIDLATIEESYMQYIQRVYAFHEIVGVKIQKKNLVWDGQNILTYSENNYHISHDNKISRKKIDNGVFLQDIVVKNKVVNSLTDMSKKGLFFLAGNIEKTIEKVIGGKECSWIQTSIISRLLEYYT